MGTLDESVEFATNPDPRCACLLLLDTSGSMAGAPVEALNDGLRAFQNDVSQDDLAQRRVEVAIVTFGGRVQVMQDFVTARDFSAPRLAATGDTPMGAAIREGVGLVRDRKAQYRANGVSYYRPWVFLITDGQPTDEWKTAAELVHEEEAGNGLAFFGVGVEGANRGILEQIAVRKPLMLRGLAFVDLFVWLSQSQRRVSASKPGEQTSLPPTGWAAV
jgi:uncharacterized protein YegL